MCLALFVGDEDDGIEQFGPLAGVVHHDVHPDGHHHGDTDRYAQIWPHSDSQQCVPHLLRAHAVCRSNNLVLVSTTRLSISETDVEDICLFYGINCFYSNIEDSYLFKI